MRLCTSNEAAQRAQAVERAQEAKECYQSRVRYGHYAVIAKKNLLVSSKQMTVVIACMDIIDACRSPLGCDSVRFACFSRSEVFYEFSKSPAWLHAG